MRVFAILGLAACFTAGAASAQDGQVIRVGDPSLSCPQIVAEAGALETLMGGAPTGVFGNEQMVNAATSVAMQGALMAGAGRVLPGVGLLGNALGAAARRDRERREAEAAQARLRWYYLSGLYTGRECDAASAQAASVDAAPATPTAPLEAAVTPAPGSEPAPETPPPAA